MTTPSHRRSVHFYLHAEADSDIINWLDSLPAYRRSSALRDVIRAQILTEDSLPGERELTPRGPASRPVRTRPTPRPLERVREPEVQPNPKQAAPDPSPVSETPLPAHESLAHESRSTEPEPTRSPSFNFAEIARSIDDQFR